MGGGDMGTVRPPVPSIRPTSVRWRLLSVAFVVCFVAYLLRMNISVAAKFMMPELGLSNLQMGWVFSAFVWGYAIFQFPGGVLCDCWGPRRTITIVTLL
jgi:ACS family glucarate transporter-like MFS transporter